MAGHDERQSPIARPCCILSFVRRTLVIASVCLAFFLPLTLPARKISERDAAVRLLTRRPVWLPLATQTLPHSVVKIHFWVAKSGTVEAIEQVCGDREFFDEIADKLLEWKFREPGNEAFTADILFARRGRRAWLAIELPPIQRPKRNDCPAE